MRKELTPDTFGELEKRFGSFHDAIIHNANFDLFSKVAPYIVRITLGVIDLSRETDDNWINLTFEIENVTKFHLAKQRIYDYAIVFQLNIGFFDGEIYFDFFPYTLNPTKLEDFEVNPDIAGSTFVVVGKKCFWYTSPYTERGLM